MTGGDFPEPAVLIRTAAEAGRVRQTVYPFRLNGRGLAGFLIAWLCLPVIVLLIALAGGAGALVPALYILVIAAVGLAYPFAAMVGARIRICEHGLIVSTLPGKRMRFFIPYTTIDPGSVMVHPVPRRGGAYRYKPVAAMNEAFPWPAMSKFIRPRARCGPGSCPGCLTGSRSTSGVRPTVSTGSASAGCTRYSPARGGAPARPCAGTRRVPSGCSARCGRCSIIQNCGPS